MITTNKNVKKTAIKKNKKTDKKKSNSLSKKTSKRPNQQLSITESQIQLLQAVEQRGSITAAAKQVGISYKTAWDRIDALNNLAVQALVVRASGGTHGGGTHLTEYGKQVVSSFLTINREHNDFLKRLGKSAPTRDDSTKLLAGYSINTSARNQYRGVIKKITRGDVSAEVEIQLSEAQFIVANITRDSLKQLGLKKGASVIALIKASWVMLSTDVKVLTSARNKLVGSVSRINSGTVNSDVIIDLGGGKTLSASVTNASVKLLGLKKGKNVCGLFKASSVILLAD